MMSHPHVALKPFALATSLLAALTCLGACSYLDQEISLSDEAFLRGVEGASYGSSSGGSGSSRSCKGGRGAAHFTGAEGSYGAELIDLEETLIEHHAPLEQGDQAGFEGLSFSVVAAQASEGREEELEEEQELAMPRTNHEVIELIAGRSVWGER